MPRGERAYQTSNHGTHVEDNPEPGEVSALLTLSRVRDHDGALGGPQKTGTDTEQRTSEDVEAIDIAVHGDEQGDGVDAVSNAAESQGIFYAQSVDEGATKKAENGKS